MHGNVWEWCQDLYDDSYQGAPTNGSARLISKYHTGLLRGGSFVSDARECRCAARLNLAHEFSNGACGFRVVAVAVA